MSKKVAILDDYAHAALTLVDWSDVQKTCDITVFDRHLSDDEMVEALRPFEVICTLRERATFSASLFAKLPNLRVLTITDTHVTTIDLEGAAKAGVMVWEAKPPASMPPIPTATPEFAWGLIIDTVRHLGEQQRRLHQGLWQNRLGQVLAGQRLGLVGLGKIGSRVAHYARAFDMDVVAWSQNLTNAAAGAAGVKRVEKDELFATSKIISIHYILGPRSRGLIGARDIGLMRKDAYLINTSRGPIVDEAALVAALKEKRIAGAGLDVFDQEPLPQDSPLRALDNANLTPHLGFVTEPVMRRFYTGMADAVAAYARGERMNIVNNV